MSLRRLTRYFWIEWIRPLALPALLIFSAKSALGDINYVPSGSMHPTLLDGDVVFVNKLAYDLRVPFTFARIAHWADPSRGDIVVCFEPGNGTRLVKRVIGLPGDTLELRHDILYLNGVPQPYGPLDRSAVRDLDPAERRAAIFATEQLGKRRHAVMALPDRPARRNFGPITIPAANYFVLGDNRDNSADSRYFGLMPRDQIIGQVNGVVVSADIHHWLKPRFDRFISRLE